MKKWEIISTAKTEDKELKVEEISNLLLENRGILFEEEREEFLHPKLEDVTPKSVGIDAKQLQKTLKRITKAIEQKEHIVVFGDYDVDGICGTAILWETLDSIGARVMPYIPHRMDEGYGLSEKGVINVLDLYPDTKLIISVDNGIVANEAVAFANEKSLDVIITDHHVADEKTPDAFAIVHTTKLCGTGVAYLLAQELLHLQSQKSQEKLQTLEDHLALVALATVADLVPLKGPNRVLLFYGLQKLRTTKRLGLHALFQEAVLDQTTIDTYAIGHAIAPRLNAAGRLEYAMDSLRLLCTKDPKRATELSMELGRINKERQQLTMESVAHAKALVKTGTHLERKFFFISHESYQQGVIGLIAGRIVEEYYRPAIVLSKGEEVSKASARSVHGFNIIEFIRTAADHLINAGGHPMAAGFTVETAKLELLEKVLEEKALELLTDEMLVRLLYIDCVLPLAMVNQELFAAIRKLAPFGMGNQEPVFASQHVFVQEKRLIGRDKTHLKLTVKDEESGKTFDAIAFGMGQRVLEFDNGDYIDIAYTVDENIWNGRRNLQLKIKDIKAKQ